MILTLIFYVFLFCVFCVLVIDGRRSSMARYALLGLLLCYAIFYIPSLQIYREILHWSGEHGEIKIHTQIDWSRINKVFIPYRGCGSLCIEMLLNRYVETVETRSAGFETLSGNRVGTSHAYVQWRLATTKEICWDETLIDDSPFSGSIFGMERSGNQGLLAQGICLIPKFTDHLSADLRFDATVEEINSESNSSVIARRRKFEAHLKTAEGLIPAATGAYRSDLLLRFPLTFGIDSREPNPGLRLDRTMVTRGVPTLRLFVQHLTRSGFAIKSSNAGSLVDEQRIQIINEAVSHPNPAVRWSAGFAFCGLGEKYSNKVDAAIDRLRNDPNRWVAAVAQNVSRVRKVRGVARCGFISRTHNGEFLRGRFLDGQVAVRTDR